MDLPTGSWSTSHPDPRLNAELAKQALGSWMHAGPRPVPLVQPAPAQGPVHSLYPQCWVSASPWPVQCPDERSLHRTNGTPGGR